MLAAMKRGIKTVFKSLDMSVANTWADEKVDFSTDFSDEQLKRGVILVQVDAELWPLSAAAAINTQLSETYVVSKTDQSASITIDDKDCLYRKVLQGCAGSDVDEIYFQDALEWPRGGKITPQRLNKLDVDDPHIYHGLTSSGLAAVRGVDAAFHFLLL